MTRWLQAARSAQLTKDKTDTTDETGHSSANAGQNANAVVTDEAPNGVVSSVRPSATSTVQSVLSVSSISSVTSFLSGGVFDASPPRAPAASRLNPDSSTARKVAHLPTHPPTCAICGATEWTVAMTDLGGRKLHVSCWKGEGQ